jgi:uncharacterized iron-regulated protein
MRKFGYPSKAASWKIIGWKTTSQKMTNFWLTCASLLLAGTIALAPAQASTISTPTGQTLTTEQTLDQIAQSQVIYLGETHDRKADHLAQLEIIQALHQRNKNIAIGLEMFQRPFQTVLDDYLADRITEAELIQKTEYEKRWGFDWELYAPIVRFAKANSIPLIALNTPTEVTRKVSRQGIPSLTLNDKRFIPPLSEIETGVTTSDPAYRQMLRDVFEQVHQSKGGEDRFNRFFSAQVLWDETMADRIVHSLIKFPDRPIIVLAGQGHIIYGHGIPSRVQRRQPNLKQTRILLNPEPDQLTQPQIADFLWVTE